MTSENINVVRVDYLSGQHATDLRRLLREYAEYETQADEPLAENHFDCLPDRLNDFPTAFSLLAYRGEDAVGLMNCFFGFSTFVQKKLINVHDVMVTERERGRGVAGRMFAAVEKIARENDCCRLTLEVLDDNQPALRAYEKHGFSRMPYHPENDTLFLLA